MNQKGPKHRGDAGSVERAVSANAAGRRITIRPDIPQVNETQGTIFELWAIADSVANRYLGSPRNLANFLKPEQGLGQGFAE